MSMPREVLAQDQHISEISPTKLKEEYLQMSGTNRLVDRIFIDILFLIFCVAHGRQECYNGIVSSENWHKGT